MANHEKYGLFLAALEEVAGADKAAEFRKAMESGGTLGLGAAAVKSGKINPAPTPDYLSPDVLNRTAAQTFMPQVMQASNAPFQTGQNALRGLSAKAGMMESPFALAAQAGLRGQQAGGAQQEAMSRAIQLGQAQSSAQVGGAAAINAIPPQFGYQMLDPLKNAFSTYAAYRGYQQQGQQASPYTFAGQRPAAFQVPNAGAYMPTGR